MSVLDLNMAGRPFVAFVGAGASAMPPSSLPTWTSFNSLLLEALGERLAEVSDQRQPTGQMLAAFHERRERTPFFAPDFQAQLMEEEIGSEYFRVWQSLDTNVFGPVHACLAELAARGRLAAIITVNFDRLIETALRARHLPFQVFHDPASFAKFAQRDRSGATLPVIKIHGSIEDSASLIDTLRQRVAGRPAALLQILHHLLREHPWIYLGFSGADFSYNRNYLGILDAAAEAKGFVFLARGGRPLEPGVVDLCAAYGPEKASVVQGELPGWLEETFTISGAAPAASAGRDPGAIPSPVPQRIRERIGEWVSGLGPMAVTNILSALLRSCGLEREAFWLLRRMWQSYRTPEDTRGPSYDRYNYNYGRALFEEGFIRNPVKLAADNSNLASWRDHADQNAYEFFARAYVSGRLLAAGAQTAAVLAYRGQAGRAIALLAEVYNHALTSTQRLDLCDVALASVPVYDILRLFEPAVAQLRQCIAIARELGDEIRRGLLSAHCGRFLTYTGDFAAADALLVEADQIGRRLGLESVVLASEAAWGRWLTDSCTTQAAAAVERLAAVAAKIEAANDAALFSTVDIFSPNPQPVPVHGHNPALCRVYLDLCRAAGFAGEPKMLDRSLNALDELTVEYFRGYCPHYYLAYAEALLDYGAGDQRAQIADLLSRAKALGERADNPWVGQQAARLEGRVR